MYYMALAILASILFLWGSLSFKRGPAPTTSFQQSVVLSEATATVAYVQDGLERAATSSEVFPNGVLAGRNSFVYEFTKTKYDEALSSSSLVALYFYADWDTLFKEEFLGMQEVFNGLITDKVSGFRVHFNDSHTSVLEEDLARQFGVSYQRTKVFLKNRKLFLKSRDVWEKARFLDEIKRAL